MVESASYFFEKAEQCRRLADRIINDTDPTRLALLALAEELGAKAKAAMAETIEEISLRDDIASPGKDDGSAA